MSPKKREVGNIGPRYTRIIRSMALNNLFLNIGNYDMFDGLLDDEQDSDPLSAEQKFCG